MAEATHENSDTTSQDGPREHAVTTDEPGLSGMLFKDLAAIFAGLSLWAAADTWYQVTGLWLAQVVAMGDAVLVGLLLAALFHEWGHYAGAKAAGAHAPRITTKKLSFFRYNFDFSVNDLRQFHWMTYGGHVGHWGILLLLLVMLPLDSLGRITLVSAIFGFVIFASVIEYNVVKDTMAGADPKTRLQGITAKDFQQAQVIGGLAGIFALAALS